MFKRIIASARIGTGKTACDLLAFEEGDTALLYSTVPPYFGLILSIWNESKVYELPAHDEQELLEMFQDQLAVEAEIRRGSTWKLMDGNA